MTDTDPSLSATHPNSRTGCWRRPPPNAAAAARRARRLREGEEQRDAERTALLGRRITHSTLMLPVLQILQERGGAAPRDLCDLLLDRLGLDPAVREATQTYRDGQTTNLFDRTVRWTLQEAKRQGLAVAPRRGHWQPTTKGADALGVVTPGIVLTVFRTEQGRAVAAWAEEAASVVEPGSLNLLFTSPLFPLLKPKSYGGLGSAEWMPWMLDLLESWLPLLAEDASIVMHLGDVHLRGMPAYSSYIERFITACQDDLGLYKHQTHFWINETRTPEQEWGAVRRMLVRSTCEPLYWLSKSPFPKADNRHILVPYTERTRVERLGRKQAKAVRPSGYDMGEWSWSKDNGGSIPGNVITASNCAGNDSYRRACRAEGLPLHPAVMPIAVPERFVLHLTDPGDLVGDFFAGSGTTIAAAQRHNRRWIGIDRASRLLEGASHRPEFRHAPGFRLDSAALPPAGG